MDLTLVASACTLMKQSLNLITTEMVALVVTDVVATVEEEGVTGAVEEAVDAMEAVLGAVLGAMVVVDVQGVTEAVVEAGVVRLTGRALVLLVQERRQNSVTTSED